MGIHRATRVVMSNAHWPLLYGVAFGPRKIMRSAQRTTVATMNVAICVRLASASRSLESPTSESLVLASFR